MKSTQNRSELNILKNGLGFRPCYVTEKYKEIPTGEEYRVNVIKEIIQIRNNELEVPGFEKHEFDEILRFVCVS